MRTTILKYINLFALLLLLGTSCTKKFDGINTNPNATTKVTASMLATDMILDITRGDISSQKSFMQPFMLGKYVTWQENQESYQYNKIGRTSFGRLTLLRNIAPMIGYALNEGNRNSYKALGHFISAWQFFQVTMMLGDIPYSEAIKGESGNNIKPKYDTQKEVFMGILNELDSANLLFSKGTDFEGDPIYEGSVDQWQRLTNSFELRVLINLYKHTDDADLKVKQRFAEVAARPLMHDYNDNFALQYSDGGNGRQKYPWYNTGGSNPFVIYPMLTNTLMAPMKTMEDRRLFYFAKPSEVQLQNGKLASDYDAYPGVESSASFSSLQSIHASRDFTDVNDRYAQLPNAEPVGMCNYWNLQFILAEAVERGWISGSAQDYYAAGIKSSMHFIAANTPDNPAYNHGVMLDDAYIQAYPNDASVKLTGTMEAQIAQIITQKYIAGFLQGSNFDAWFEHRRTGYPEFIINPNSNLNLPSDKLPLRWLYPSNELAHNADNVAAAIQSQYNGNDNVNGVMWILK